MKTYDDNGFGEVKLTGGRNAPTTRTSRRSNWSPAAKPNRTQCWTFSGRRATPQLCNCSRMTAKMNCRTSRAAIHPFSMSSAGAGANLWIR